MGIRLGAAKAVSGALTWGLQSLLHRKAGNFPGKMALYVDPRLIADLRGRLSEGSVIVVGTNGKTSVNNLIADTLERAGYTVSCNRSGANLDSGVASALLQTKQAQWGVYESDELWLAKVLPQLQATYVVLLNLFRDQLDRCGEISRIQDSICQALESSPDTVLIYNADDPQCAIIAERVSNRSVAFGVDGSMGLAQNTVSDAQMCQRCEAMIDYHYRQYGQLGDYFCPSCGFTRPELDVVASHVRLGADKTEFKVSFPPDEAHLTLTQGTPYLVYNLLAVYTLSTMLEIPVEIVQQAIDDFDPQNGRLQNYTIQGFPTLLNLAKNPTGFNQNLKIVENNKGPKAVAFFINDKIVDGRDISWIWDIDFEELAGHADTRVYAGGIRKNDLQVRLKYAGIDAKLIESIEEVYDDLAALGADPTSEWVYAIANYTALPEVHRDLDRLAAAALGAANLGAADTDAANLGAADTDAANSVAADLGAADDEKGEPGSAVIRPHCQSDQSTTPVQIAVPGQNTAQHQTTISSQAATQDQSTTSDKTIASGEPLVICHILPDLLNLYGDGGNVRILCQRLRWRGIPVGLRTVRYGDALDLNDVDLVFMGGGPDREQKLASEQLFAAKDLLKKYVEADGVLLAICGGYQILGAHWLMGDDLVEGLNLVDIETRRPGTSADRLIDDMVLSSPLATWPVVGYENHAGRTYLGDGLESFGRVISAAGHGNNDKDRSDGVLYRKVIGTYSHGPLLAKNPQVADYLLTEALKRRARRLGLSPDDSVTSYLPLSPLNDEVEKAANEYMCARLKVS